MSSKIQVKCLFVILVLALSATTQAEIPVVEWVSQLGSVGENVGWDFGGGVSVDGNGNAYVTGFTQGSLDGNTHYGSSDVFLMKYDTNGSKVWVKQVGTSGSDVGFGVSVDSSNNIYVTGSTDSDFNGKTNAGLSDVLLTKFDTNGNTLWTQLLGTTSYEHGYGVSVDGNDNVYVTGYTSGDIDGDLNGNSHMGGWDMFLTKYTSDGNQQWIQQLGSAGDDVSYGVSIDDNGNAYVTGYTDGTLDGKANMGGPDTFLTKYTTNGTKQWTQLLGTDSYDRSYSVSVDSNGNAYITGDTYGDLDGNTNLGGQDLFLMKYDTNGMKQWTKQLGTANNDIGKGVSIDDNDNVYVTGYSYSDPYGNADVWLIKYDTNGTEIWAEQFGTDSGDFCWDVAVEGNGTAYVTGHTVGSFGDNDNAGHLDVFLAKISTVPEPGSFALLAGIAFMALLYRRCKRG